MDFARFSGHEHLDGGFAIRLIGRAERNHALGQAVFQALAEHLQGFGSAFAQDMGDHRQSFDIAGARD